LHRAMTDKRYDDEESDSEGEHNRGVHYERVAGVPEPGAFRLPHRVIHKLPPPLPAAQRPFDMLISAMQAMRPNNFVFTLG
jgi:hypothetical protein